MKEELIVEKRFSVILIMNWHLGRKRKLQEKKRGWDRGKIQQI